MNGKYLLIIFMIAVIVLLCFMKYIKIESISSKEKVKTVAILILTIILCYLLIVLSRYFNDNLCNINSNYVRDRETAISIAKAVYKVKTEREYQTEDFFVEFDKKNNEWHIYTIYEDDPNDNVFVVGYYGLYINADTGSITKMSLKGE